MTVRIRKFPFAIKISTQNLTRWYLPKQGEAAREIPAKHRKLHLTKCPKVPGLCFSCKNGNKEFNFDSEK